MRGRLVPTLVVSLVSVLCLWPVVYPSKLLDARAGGGTTEASTGAEARDLTVPPGDLYLVGTAHLDTQWRWTIQMTISDYIPATLLENFALFEKYPDYVFSFEGAFRYMLMKEYYPAEYERLKDYVAAGRWRVAGSWLDAVDTNIPAPESLIRHTLYGNGFFRREFGVTSRDIFLPDCFGFGFALPSIATHCGLLGFSTQKLTWGSSVGIPFEIGMWEGVDGSTIVAAMNPGAYVSDIEGDLSNDSHSIEIVRKQGEESGLGAGYRYFGTGDRGGAPTNESVAWLQRSLHGAGPLQVHGVASDQLARDVMDQLDADQRARLPHYRGELLMTRHGVGCYTSQAAMKRWNRQNEILADAAERAAVVADYLGALHYPRETLREAWTRFLWHQFHDDLTGTSIPEAYTFSWNDEILSLNQFAAVLTDAVGGVSRALDTRVEGLPVVVFNPLSIEREDIVRIRPESRRSAGQVHVYGPDGEEVPAQWSQQGGCYFLARVPALGFAVFDVRPGPAPYTLETGVTATDSTLENARYRVKGQGSKLTSIYDKRAGRELLAAPIELQLLDDAPENWAAWEIDHEDLSAEPRPFTGAEAIGSLYEEGPALITFMLEHEREESTYRYYISLAAGDAGDRIEVELVIDWRTPATLLKATFPLAVQNEQATYDLRLGTIQRGTNTPQLYEVPAQRWADLTAADCSYGVAILNDSRYGWDKPDDHTLRLSLIHTPAVNENWRWIDDQKSQDLGRHRIRYAILGHEGEWGSEVTWQADRFNQPLLAFSVPQHKGELGKQFSLLEVRQRGRGADRHPTVAVRAVKLADESQEIVIRLQELVGEPARDVEVRFAGPVSSAREVNGAEEALDTPLGRLAVEDGALRVDLNPYQPRAFAVRLEQAPVQLSPPSGKALDLPYNLDGISRDEDRTDGDLDGSDNTLAGELLPPVLVREGIPFRTGPQQPGEPNVLVARGQEFSLPAGDFNRLYLLAAAVGGGRRVTFDIDGVANSLWLQDYAEPVGQWDSRLSGGQFHEDPAAITTGYINRSRVGWVGTHRHGSDGLNEPYVFTHFFKLRLELASGARVLRLPDDPQVRILAITAAHNENDTAEPYWPLYDRIETTTVEILSARRTFTDSVVVTLRSPNPDAVIRYTLTGAGGRSKTMEYGGPFAVKETTLVEARAHAPGMQSEHVARAEFTRAIPLAPVAPGDMESGLLCHYHEGAWEKLPDFFELSPSRTGVMSTVAVPDFAREEDIGLVLTGYVRAPARGVYRFHLWSDDGSAMYVHDKQVIANDGLHGRAEVWADVPLEGGLHPLRIDFFQHLGGVALELWWEGPGVELQQVPADALSCSAS